MLQDISARVQEGARRAGLAVPQPLAAKLAVYYEVLDHWNEKINLTSLTDPEEAIDRLLLEPLAAAKFLPAQPVLMDLGSGGGSPALPLALALDARSLVMVESRQRKAAFLREAIRELGIQATVETARFEQLAKDSAFASRMDVVSVRAVRLDSPVLEAIAALLKPSGVAALFRGIEGGARPDGLPGNLKWVSTDPLLRSATRRLTRLTRL
jgi:16S rRNA (guanine527-N7)-methyltransferase